jgi:hypothetical protein
VILKKKTIFLSKLNSGQRTTWKLDTKNYNIEVVGGTPSHQTLWLCHSGEAEEMREEDAKRQKLHAEKIRQANIGRKDDGRYVKIAMTKSKQRWYTNGETTIMVEPGAQPIGFFPGRKLNG